MPKNSSQPNQAKPPKLRFPGFEGAWEEKKIDEISKVNPTTNNLPDSFVYIDLESVENGVLVQQNTILKTVAPSRAQRCLTKGDILFQMVRPYQQNNLLFNFNGDFVASTGYAQIRTKESSEFLYYSFHTLHFLNKVLIRCTGSSYPAINSNDFKKIKINLPQLPEQQKIASFLAEVDAWIENLREQKKSLESYKKSLMQKIFSQQIRFKDEKGCDFAEWEEKKIEDVFQVTRGHVLAVKDMSEVKTREFLYPVYSSQTKEGGLIGYYNDFLFEDVITWTTDGANAGDVNFRKGKFYCTNVCGVLISNEGSANECIAQLLNTIAYKFVSKVGNPKLMNNIMSKIKINFPSLPEQQKIADLLTSVDKSIESKQQQITEAEEWKKGLMQGLFV